MFKLLFAVCGIAMAPMAFASGILDKVTEGVSEGVEKVGDAVTGTADKVGDTIDATTKNIGETIDGTAEMISDEETPELTRERLDAMADETLERLFADNTAAKELYDAASGYAVFDARQVGVAGVAAGFGRGVAVSLPSRDRTYMKMGTGGVGLSFGLGGFERRIVILFETPDAFQSFVTVGIDATADAGAMFGEDKSDQAIRFVDGRSVFVLTKKGWKISSSVTGTKYWADGDLN
ncbi:hypothetical protein ROA7450_01548 [Roseovarius albus]|uniref:Ysc84 actin-binding domain-containing protein n=1 Tax=Roseovarius albus TaxID=1247867 RepID=A0A1X6YXS9_9RHOB|nr:hypothetical protein [Roseovarius albus]SLN34435.1 hypothetical protein ROA7450_01548 [Roseovarius albus]